MTDSSPGADLLNQYDIDFVHAMYLLGVSTDFIALRLKIKHGWSNDRQLDPVLITEVKSVVTRLQVDHKNVTVDMFVAQMPEVMADDIVKGLRWDTARRVCVESGKSKNIRARTQKIATVYKKEEDALKGFRFVHGQDAVPQDKKSPAFRAWDREQAWGLQTMLNNQRGHMAATLQRIWNDALNAAPAIFGQTSAHTPAAALTALTCIRNDHTSCNHDLYHESYEYEHVADMTF